MRVQPSEESGPRGGELRPARPEEAATLTALALRAKRHWGYDEAFMAAVAPGMAVAAEDIATGDCWVVARAGQPVAFGLRFGALLDALFVLPPAIGRGHGSRLLRHLAARAKAEGHGGLDIVADPFAAGFYERHGAVRVGDQPSRDIPGRVLPVYRLPL